GLSCCVSASDFCSASGCGSAVFVTPGLNPGGLLAGGLCCWVSALDFCSASGWGSAVFVTPGLNRGLNPAGLFWLSERTFCLVAEVGPPDVCSDVSSFCRGAATVLVRCLSACPCVSARSACSGAAFGSGYCRRSLLNQNF